MKVEVPKKTVLPKIKVSSDEESDESDETEEGSEEESTSEEYSDASSDESENERNRHGGKSKCINNNDDQLGDCCRHGLLKINNQQYALVSKPNESPYGKITRAKQGQAALTK